MVKNIRKAAFPPLRSNDPGETGTRDFVSFPMRPPKRIRQVEWAYPWRCRKRPFVLATKTGKPSVNLLMYAIQRKCHFDIASKEMTALSAIPDGMTT